jgi:pyrroline-5-carboxylate reductase
MTKNLLLVGCGKMGGALLQGWLDRDVNLRVTVIEPGAGFDRFAGLPNVAGVAALSALAADFQAEVVVFAVKPQVLGDITGGYSRFVTQDTVFLSIAAGKTIDFFQAHLGPEASIVRAMPNTPCAIGRGMTVLCANNKTSEEHSALCEVLMRAGGKVAWVATEQLMDAVTAVSGSGPAYVFQLIETMAEAGVRLGLSIDLALELARETVAGAGELARRATEPVSELRRAVTSPGGTTQAALDVLRAPNGIQPLFDRALRAAADRGRELAD